MLDNIFDMIYYISIKAKEDKRQMPVLSRYKGYVITMRLRRKEHNPPHIHVEYGNEEGLFTLSDGELVEGWIPKKGQKYVKEFILQYQDKLLEMWQTQNFEMLPPLK